MTGYRSTVIHTTNGHFTWNFYRVCMMSRKRDTRSGKSFANEEKERERENMKKKKKWYNSHESHISIDMQCKNIQNTSLARIWNGHANENREKRGMQLVEMCKPWPNSLTKESFFFLNNRDRLHEHFIIWTRSGRLPPSPAPNFAT